MIWLGEFNLHHPLWDKECNGHLFMRSNLEKSQVLIDTLADFDLQIALPKYILMLQALQPARSDHILVVMEVDLSLEEWVEPLHPNFRSVDWKEVRETLSCRLKELEAGEMVNTHGKFFFWLGELTCMISGTIEDCILKVGTPPYQKHWWSPLLSARCMEL